MPPTFGYAMILMTYVMAGAVGLAVCLLLAFFPPLRAGARRTAGGIIGSFAGVFLFQILTLPFVALMLFVFGACSKYLVILTVSLKKSRLPRS